VHVRSPALFGCGLDERNARYNFLELFAGNRMYRESKLKQCYMYSWAIVGACMQTLMHIQNNSPFLSHCPLFFLLVCSTVSVYIFLSVWRLVHMKTFFLACVSGPSHLRISNVSALATRHVLCCYTFITCQRETHYSYRQPLLNGVTCSTISL
jgi:hypothetical protein